MIHLHRLRLTGPRRHYEVDFDKSVNNLSIIAGQIHTGKTTVLEFVRYALGGTGHPTHPELARTVRSCELEISINGERWTIERPLFSSDLDVAYIHAGGIDDESDRVRKTIDPPGDEGALSRWILDSIGMADARVRVTDGNPNSSTHTLSIRDLMWTAYLPSKRLDNDALLHEPNDYKHFKLRQVIEILFDVHDDRLGQLMDLQREIRQELTQAKTEAESVRTFLAEEEVPARGKVIEDITKLETARSEASAKLADLTQRAAKNSGHADGLRKQHAAARRSSARAAARVRDRRALLDRLMPLRGQYAEDERKLAFAHEAHQLFDPLHVQSCPACLEQLPAPAEVSAGACTLCQQPIRETADELFSVASERRRVRAKIKDLDAFMGSVEQQVRTSESDLAAAEREEAEVAGQLNTATADALSPFVAERDQLVAAITKLDGRDRELRRALRWYDALGRREGQVGQLTNRLADVRKQLQELRNDQPDRAQVVSQVSSRFASLLREWQYPKVDEDGVPSVDDKFVPHVRGRAYRDVGSDGAKTLIALAWTLAIYELAIEGGAPHPGFLMLDSVQKNLAPKSGQAADEFMDPAIVDRMYKHVADWLGSHPDAQIIVVDHVPPVEVEASVVARYSGKIEQPPYGLIDDETGRT